MAAPSEPVTGLVEAPVQRTIRVVGLVLILWGVSSEVRPGLHGAHLGAWILAAAVVPAWFAWTMPGGHEWRRLTLAAFFWLAAVGGALATFAPVALAVVGSAALGASINFELPVAALVAATGPLALLLAAAVAGRDKGVAVGVASAALVGAVLGFARRQAADRARTDALVAVEHDRADLAAARAGVLAERNHLAREVHDVLAHTLGALTVQLEALNARLDSAPEVPAFVRDGLERTRALAADGLVEARRAVRALRDDAEPLHEQLAKLCVHSGADLTVSGSPNVLPPQQTLALYRVAQESLANAAKHAPGAAARVHVAYAADATRLTVRNDTPAAAAGPLAASGGHYGLEGIRERVRLLGGEVVAGPVGSGFTVDARVPR